MDNLETLLQNLENSRKNSTHGTWQIDSQGYDVFSSKTRVVSADPQWNYAPGKLSCVENLKFCALSANHILQLIEIIRVQKEALDKYKVFGIHPTNEEFMAGINKIYFAQEAIAKVEEIAGRK